MAGRNFSLTPRLSLFVDRQVGSGRHQNASEVVREALRRYEAVLVEEKARIIAIRGDYTLVESANDEAQLYTDPAGRAPTKRHVHAASRG
jgi:antitoxin ParD1/3/4